MNALQTLKKTIRTMNSLIEYKESFVRILNMAADYGDQIPAVYETHLVNTTTLVSKTWDEVVVLTEQFDACAPMENTTEAGVEILKLQAVLLKLEVVDQEQDKAKNRFKEAHNGKRDGE